MTEYWVSQGNKWCDFCKIWIQNNPTSIRNHELGKRHRECVDKKLTDMREKSAAKDKELKKNEKLLQQIEAKATRSYQKDIATAQQVAKANGAPEDGTAENHHQRAKRFPLLSHSQVGCLTVLQAIITTRPMVCTMIQSLDSITVIQ
ncbi:PREDICTED: zinc finger protein ZOP1 isoform X2 [Camelina sativa]|uniref:Zinc finger protein ZOP1 isoform X2 n=1 Tax=Camelina sativa TaxID=90675 RepID=A0ABM0X1X9_CAMSA|nr:PREDICTED: zinc finger protein ZOP1 isoform X2 [Camelina sativa]